MTASSSPVKSNMQRSNAFRRCGTRATRTVGGRSRSGSAGPNTRQSSPPPTYENVPGVHPPPYVDTARVPRYRHHRQDRLLASQPITAYYEELQTESGAETTYAAIGYPLRPQSRRQVEITPPDNSDWFEQGWHVEADLDRTLEKNLSYFRRVLLYLRSNWDTPINSDIESIVKASRVRYRSLAREIRGFYARWLNHQLAVTQAKHQIFKNDEHSLWERAFESITHQHEKIVAKRQINQELTTRLAALEEAINKIQLQHNSIHIRSTGLEQW